MKNFLIGSLLLICLLSACGNGNHINTNGNLSKAEQTLDSLYKYYLPEGTNLLRETYPFKQDYAATYLASEEQANIPNPYAYLWPYSGTFSAVNALYEATNNNSYKELLENRVLPGLEEYFDTERPIYAYASYINDAPPSDRFYDDNVWLGIDFTDLYQQTKEQKYLDKAILIWKFIESGMDDNLGGGIYWCEQKKHSKNTCSNAPGAVYALKLFLATNDSTYYNQGRFLYNWTKEHLQDSEDHLYFDNISLDGRIGRAKFAYNSGQMLQAAALLYKITNNEEYLKEAQQVAASCYNYFFTDVKVGDKQMKLIKNGDNWFTAVMLRGFIELYHLDNNPLYLNAFQNSLDYAWSEIREENGLFEDNRFAGATSDKPTKWLLTQAAMVEMYARLAAIK